jgi:hypothetical protein
MNQSADEELGIFPTIQRPDDFGFQGDFGLRAV